MKDFKESQWLPEKLIRYLSGNKLLLLSTIDAEDDGPNISAVSWARAIDDKHIRFAFSSNSRIVTNIKHNPKSVITILGLNSVFSIQGECSILEDLMEDVSINLSKIEMNVESVRNSMFWGAELSVEPEYIKTYDEAKAQKLDEQVYKALLKG